MAAIKQRTALRDDDQWAAPCDLKFGSNRLRTRGRPSGMQPRRNKAAAAPIGNASHRTRVVRANFWSSAARVSQLAKDLTSGYVTISV